MVVEIAVVLKRTNRTKNWGGLEACMAHWLADFVRLLAAYRLAFSSLVGTSGMGRYGKLPLLLCGGLAKGSGKA